MCCDLPRIESSRVVTKMIGPRRSHAVAIFPICQYVGPVLFKKENNVRIFRANIQF